MKILKGKNGVNKMNLRPIFTQLISLFIFFSYANQSGLIAKPPDYIEKSRLLVLTDIENEPDDAQSMVRLLSHSNMYEIEGIIATTSCWLRNKTAGWRIHEIVDAYGKVRENLTLHEEGFPEYDYLKSVVKTGMPVFGMGGVGEGMDSEGSEWIIKVVDEEDDRPVWITAWGGANCLAQALWKVKQTRSKIELDKFVSKIRIYTISDQDDSGPWMRENFPNLFYIVSPGKEENGSGGYHYATWCGISGDKFHGRFRGPDFSLVDNPWLDENIRRNHGPLGAEHPHTEYLMEGDTPSFLYLFPNGLVSPENPNFGSWGGRYEYYTPKTEKWFYQPETRPIWTNAVDEVYVRDDHHYTSNQATIWRWRQAYQHEFAARIDWTIKSYDEANHPPVAELAHSNLVTVTSGKEVKLQAGDCTDPDGDSLSYNWIFYREVGTFVGWLRLDGSDSKQVKFKAPDVDSPQTMHIIMEVTDNGEPSLTRYQRIIVTVNPS